MKLLRILVLLNLVLGAPLSVAQGDSEPEAFKIFDNLYYVGIAFVSAYVIPTSAGLILIDSTYDTNVDHVLGGVRNMGFDPADIKYIFVTHWHADHLGGASRIHALTGATVGMIKQDWESRYVDHDIPKSSQMVIEDGQSFTLGDTTLKFFHTPGHTLGVLSIEYTFYDDGVPYQGFTFGGTGFNFKGVEQTEMYIASVKRIMKMKGIQVNIGNHQTLGDIFERAEGLATRKPGDPHPFVAPEDFQDFLSGLLTGAKKKLVREKKSASAKKKRNRN